MSVNTLWSRALVAVGITVGLMLSPLQADELLKQGETVIPVMFVQNAAASHYHDGVLTLSGIKPELLWFSNRPYRMAGTSTLAEYMQDWDDGVDSFKADPPNATLSYLSDGAMASVAIELSNPLPVGDSISYQVKLLQGELPAHTGPLSLFIDFVGMVWHRPVGGAVVVRRPLVVGRPFLFRRPAVVVVKPAPVVVINKQPAATVVVQQDVPTVVVAKRGSPSEIKVYSTSETEQKLRQLKSMYDQGLISRSEYKHKQEELLKQF